MMRMYIHAKCHPDEIIVHTDFVFFFLVCVICTCTCTYLCGMYRLSR